MLLYDYASDLYNLTSKIEFGDDRNENGSKN